MLNRIYSLYEPKRFKQIIQEQSLKPEELIVRPTYMSICVADQRYYRGTRKKEVLDKKLPMALIHEAIGKVVFDPSGKFTEGETVVILPNLPCNNCKACNNDKIGENYCRNGNFCSSGYDGFMQELVFHPIERVIKLPNNISFEILAFTELMSVPMHVINRFQKFSNENRHIFGVWGDGNVGFITSLLLKTIFPNSKIIVFGVNREKLQYFTFADETKLVTEVNDTLNIDHAFECVGSRNSEDAIRQIIDIINPGGSINLLGVSEEEIEINTRMVLEKGLILLGHSRSTKKDYIDVLDLIEKNNLSNYFENLISNKIEIKNISDMIKAFEMDKIKSHGKTIMKWEV